MPITAARLRRAAIARCDRYFVRPIRHLIQLASRPRRIARYLAAHATPALILGAGPQRRAGWLATDLQPSSGDVLYLDATKRLPFANDSFAYIFAEHMFEHVPYDAGIRLAAEALRILRPGGVFRIATPDLQAVARLALPPLDQAAQDYVSASNNLFGHHVGNEPAFAVNRVFRWWGHEFIYDEKSLRDLLTGTGFAVARRMIGDSEHAQLRGLENHGDVVGQQMNAYETMVLEATKPKAAAD